MTTVSYLDEGFYDNFTPSLPEESMADRVDLDGSGSDQGSSGNTSIFSDKIWACEIQLDSTMPPDVHFQDAERSIAAYPTYSGYSCGQNLRKEPPLLVVQIPWTLALGHSLENEKISTAPQDHIAGN